jgi:hypothetical protein
MESMVYHQVQVQEILATRYRYLLDRHMTPLSMLLMVYQLPRCLMHRWQTQTWGVLALSKGDSRGSAVSISDVDMVIRNVIHVHIFILLPT